MSWRITRLVNTLCRLALLLPAVAANAGQSEGCGRPLPAGPLPVVAIDGVQRDFILAVPDGYRNDRPHALVFAFHGRTNTNSQVRSYFRLESAAAREALLVYPAATRDDKGHNHWWRPNDKADALRDYELFDKLLAMLGEQYCIDPARVYLVGHSLGATFANSLACARAGKVRALVSVAGGIEPTRCSGRVAAMLLHNPKDALVSIKDGERARDLFLDNNDLAHDSVPTEPRNLNCERYGSGGEADPVIWCAHHHDLNGHRRYYPHNWPKETATAAFHFFTSLEPRGQTKPTN